VLSDEFAGAKQLIYKSPSIYERRRRVLSAARRLIAEHGLPGFSIRELSENSGISQKTIYNAFGNKENVIATAIRQYIADFDAATTYENDEKTIIGRLERLIKVHSRNMQIRPYTTAVMAIYNSHTADGAIRAAIRDVAYARLTPFAQELQRRRQYVAGVDAVAFSQHATTIQYAVLSEWCVGALAQERFIDEMCAAFLVALAGSTRGETAREARHWLADLRSPAAPWVSLRDRAACPRAPAANAEAAPKRDDADD